MDSPFALLSVEALDDWVSSVAEGRGAWFVLVVAFALGLRHASDPDHLVAVTTLVASAGERRKRLAAYLGAAWGAGHATTLLAFGLPVVLLHAQIPASVERAAEALVGAVIVLLGARLLRSWRRGAFHVHVHDHGGERHAHVHAHAVGRSHHHRHLVRTARQAYVVGTVHGLAGTAGVTVLLLAAIPERAGAAAALLALAIGSAVSMSLLSSAFGALLGTPWARRSLAVVAPGLGAAAAAFGAWYAVAAMIGA